MPNPNNCLRYWDLADHIRIDDAIALWCGVDSGEAPYLGPVRQDEQGLLQRIEVNDLLPDAVHELLYAGDPTGMPT